MSAEGICVDPAQLPEIWPRVSFMVRRAMERGDTTFEEIERDIFSGNALLWLAVDDETILAAVVTHLEIVKNVKVCTITACAGTGLETILPLEAQLEQFGRDQDCRKMRINGRPGWARVLPKYRTRYIVLEKEI